MPRIARPTRAACAHAVTPGRRVTKHAAGAFVCTFSGTKPAPQRSGSSCARIEREALTGGSNDETGNRVTVVFRKPADSGSRPGAPGGCVGRRPERQPEARATAPGGRQATRRRCGARLEHARRAASRDRADREGVQGPALGRDRSSQSHRWLRTGDDRAGAFSGADEEGQDPEPAGGTRAGRRAPTGTQRVGRDRQGAGREARARRERGEESRKGDRSHRREARQDGQGQSREGREAGEDGEAGQAGKAWPLTGTALRRVGERTTHSARRTSAAPFSLEETTCAIAPR